MADQTDTTQTIEAAYDMIRSLVMESRVACMELRASAPHLGQHASADVYRAEAALRAIADKAAVMLTDRAITVEERTDTPVRVVSLTSRRSGKSHAGLINRLEWVTDPGISPADRLGRRAHLTEHDLRCCIEALQEQKQTPAPQSAEFTYGPCKDCPGQHSLMCCTQVIKPEVTEEDRNLRDWIIRRQGDLHVHAETLDRLLAQHRVAVIKAGEQFAEVVRNHEAFIKQIFTTIDKTLAGVQPWKTQSSDSP